MAQIKRLSWTNAATAVARNESVGFDVVRMEIFELQATTPEYYDWSLDMGQDALFVTSTPTFVTSDGIIQLAQDASYGAAISGFTNAANGVITVTDTAVFGYAVGDTIKVAGVADDGSGTLSLNNNFVIASLTATTITVEETTTVTAYSVYVSDGVATRVEDVDGEAIPIENQAIRGVTIGTAAVGPDAADMVAICYGEEPVV